jgi:hypothetical protein
MGGAMYWTVGMYQCMYVFTDLIAMYTSIFACMVQLYVAGADVFRSLSRMRRGRCMVLLDAAIKGMKK